MPSLREAATQALEAMESAEVDPHSSDAIHKAITALKAALAEPVQDGCDHCNHPMYAAIKCRVCGRVTSEHLTPGSEHLGSEHLGSEQMAEPVAWMMVNPTHPRLHKSLHWKPQTDWHITWESVPLYSAPPQRKPLTEEEALDIARTFGAQPWPPGSCVAFARGVERAHGIGGET